MRTVAFCEIEPYPRAVLRKHWPNVLIYDDVRTLTAERLKADGISVDLICGGFPCQDISVAGKGAGITGERSGLWSEYARLLSEIRPRFAIVENVAALLGRGLSRVLGDLAEIGYDAEWQIISAADVGASHRRERVWIVAYPRSAGWNEGNICDKRINGESFIQRATTKLEQPSETSLFMAESEGIAARGLSIRTEKEYARFKCNGKDVSYASSIGQLGQGQSIQRSCKTPDGERQANIFESIRIGGKWPVESNVGRVAHGIPSRMDRLKGLGNAVVPQIPEIIGRAIMELIA